MTFLNRECIHTVQNLKNTYKFTKKTKNKNKKNSLLLIAIQGPPPQPIDNVSFLRIFLERHVACTSQQRCVCMVCMCVCVCKCAYRCSFVSFWLWKMQKQTKCYHGNPCSHHPTSSSINLRIILFQSHTPVPSQTSQHSICKYFCVSI